MAAEQKDNATWYLRMFSYLLVICGLFDLATGGVVIYQTVVEGGPTGASLAIPPLMLGAASAVTGGITAAAGVVGRIASRNEARLGALCTLALAGVVATVLGLGLCYAAGGQLPTSLIFNLFLMGICVALARNLRRNFNQGSPKL